MPEPTVSSQEKLLERLRSPNQGVYSVCCSHPEVLKAAMEFCKSGTERDLEGLKAYPLIIESTSNQVDQYGGYTGMKPADFMAYVHQLAAEVGFPASSLVLGGDHLGPNAWQHEDAEIAMQKAEVLVQDYVTAGYSKIHLDASMACAGDPVDEHGALSDDLVASRAARLCRAAEAAHQNSSDRSEPPLYIIGTEVPTPGGSIQDEKDMMPTSTTAARHTYKHTKQVFFEQGLEEAWKRVVAMVVQPGVEFSDDSIAHYCPERATGLSKLTVELGLCFEAHSTDYQLPKNLRHLVRDSFSILKVGPWLTYAYREALLALGHIARQMGSGFDFHAELLSYLQQNPMYWKNYYHGSPDEVAYKCLYSLSDRIRYYWPHKEMESLVKQLYRELGTGSLPYSLVSQYFPQAIEEQQEWTAEKLVRHRIQNVLKHYEYAITGYTTLSKREAGL